MRCGCNSLSVASASVESMSDTPPAARSRPIARSSQPLPGQHLPGASLADSEQVRAEVDGLLARLADRADADPADAITHRAEVLEQAHDVLVAALATLDKI